MDNVIAKSYIKYLIVGILLAFLIILLLPKDKTLAYKGLRNDYVKGGWIYERLVDDNRPIDIAFVGTSHTEGNVDDELIERGLKKNFQHLYHVANMAIPQHGRNMHYVITKEIFKYKTPSYLIIEVKAYESRKSHKLFSQVADIEDVITPAFTINIFAFRDLFSSMRWQIAQYLIPQKMGSEYYADYGFRNNDPGISLDVKLLQKLVEKRKSIVDESYFGGNLDAIEFSLPRNYIRKIVQLAKVNGAKVIFLYLPYYGAPPEPGDINFYKNFGDVWIPPAEVLGNVDYWKDAGHLNTKGAYALVPWLEDKFIDEINESKSKLQ
ncbi:MAG: hypothetical protein QM500_01960 [Methylococcales bacterium]